MKQLLGAAALVGTLAAGAAHAQTSANVALTTDYIFRGVSQSDNGPAIQGGFDWSSQRFYAGVWASNVTEGIEMNLYGGVTPTTGPVEWDLGLIGYFYPGADDADGEFDHFEFLVGARTPVSDSVAIGGGVHYSPDNFRNTGEAVYYELNAEYAPTPALLFSAAFGNQSIENPDGLPGGAGRDDYNTWNIGAAYAIHGFTLDLRYHDTDIEAGSDIEFYTYGPASYDGAVVLTISRRL